MSSHEVNREAPAAPGPPWTLPSSSARPSAAPAIELGYEPSYPQAACHRLPGDPADISAGGEHAPAPETAASLRFNRPRHCARLGESQCPGLCHLSAQGRDTTPRCAGAADSSAEPNIAKARSHARLEPAGDDAHGPPARSTVVSHRADARVQIDRFRTRHPGAFRPLRARGPVQGPAIARPASAAGRLASAV